MYKTFLLIVSSLYICCSCQENFDNHLKREASEYTQKHCPEYIEEGNTLDSLSYDIKARNLIRWHTLSGTMDTPAARDALIIHSSEVKAQLLRELRNDVQKETGKDEKILFTYIYRSISTKDIVFQTTFTPNDYQR